MIDHLLGRPSTSLKRLQVLAVLALWATVLKRTPRSGPKRLTWLRWANKQAGECSKKVMKPSDIRSLNTSLLAFHSLIGNFAPWKLVVTALMLLYTIRHVDDILGVGAPEPLARMYSRSFYRVTWIVTAMDAGFATAMNVKPKWLRDILSVVFSVYYVIYANEADEKLRKYRALCTVEMLRTCWHKTTNPYIRMVTWFHRPSLPIARPILLPRPTIGAHSKRPINAWLFYANGKEAELAKEEELYLDFPGGGFICMNPLHHEERLRQLAKEVRKPILAIDYCKAPEYPFPYAIQECFDVYRTLVETRGKAVGMSGSSRFRVVLSGDSAGGNIATAVMLQILEYPQPHIKDAYTSLAAESTPPPLPKPLCMVLAYPSLNFSFTAWMKPEHLRVLKAQSEVNLENLRLQAARAGGSLGDSKAARRGSPLRPRSRSRSRQNSTARLPPLSPKPDSASSSRRPSTYLPLASQAELHLEDRARLADAEPTQEEENDRTTDSAMRAFNAPTAADLQDKEARFWQMQRPASKEEEEQRLLAEKQQKVDEEFIERNKTAPLGTRLTMSSMSGYFQDRILTQSMMRAMCICYIGNRRQPDFDNDYLLSPVVTPARLLAEFPPVLFICGEKDPIADDTVIMAGRIREAKLAKQAELRRRRAGTSARFGEGLRMSVGATENKPIDPIEEEDVEDWVQMRIISSVSHGFLQMGALWPEAKHIISFIAAWVVEAFEEEEDALAELRQVLHGANKSHTMPAAPLSSADEGTSSASALTGDGLLHPNEAVDADDEDEGEPLSFTPKKMRSPSVRSPSMSATARLDSPNSARPQFVKSPQNEKPQSPAVLSLKAEHGAGAISGSGSGSEAPFPAAEPIALDPHASAAVANSGGTQSSTRTRPSSFSDIKEARQRMQGTMNESLHESNSTSPPDSLPATTLALPGQQPVPGASSSSVPGTRATSPHGLRGASPHSLSPGSGGRRASRGMAAAMDDRTKALLVNEDSLLQRRRLEAVSGLGSSAVHDEAIDEDDEDSQQRGRERVA